MPALSNQRHELFYVYAVRINGRTRYVGKGSGGRYMIHLTRSHNPALASEIAAAKANGEPFRVRIVKSHLTERQAFRLERRMIAKWGGRLVNDALGNGTAMDSVAAACRADVRTIKSEDQIRAEGSWGGVALADRLAIRQSILARLARLEVLTAAS